MYKIFLAMLVFSAMALSCSPPVETVPAATPTPLKEKPVVTATPAPTPGQDIRPSPAPATTPTAIPKGEVKVSLSEQVLGKVKTFIEEEPTFRFDGIKESLKLAGERTLEEGKTWELVYTFESRYAGYGDRSGRVTIPVITPHKVRIVIRGENIAEAVMDGQWDMLMQRTIGR